MMVSRMNTCSLILITYTLVLLFIITTRYEISGIKNLITARYQIKDFRYKEYTSAKECSVEQKFPDKLEENVKIIEKYNFSVPERYIKFLQLDQKGIAALTSQRETSEVPVLVSGISSNHFKELRTNMHFNSRNLLRSFPTMKVIIFDLGLKHDEINYIRHNFKNFTIRKFPFEMFPIHFRKLGHYCWKSIAVQMILQEFDLVYWTDSSIITYPKKAKDLFQRAIRHGIQTAIAGRGKSIIKEDFRLTIADRTSRTTFKFLNEDPCLYRYKTVLGGWILIKRSQFTLKNIMFPWVSCALQFGCMDFPNSGRLFKCPKGGGTKVGSCHRYDQSVLGILLTRLFHKNRDDVTFLDEHYGSIRRM